jgi:valyl-tRNA synthetase
MLTREGQDVKLAENRFEEGRRFANKVWNATRFVLLNLEGSRTAGSTGEALELEDRWILSRLARTRDEVTRALDEYRFNDAALGLYRFVWNDFCDWYLELCKHRLGGGESPTARAARGTLARVLRDALALLHPFTPFLTEVLWKALSERLSEEAPMLVRASWPDGAGLEIDKAAEAEMVVVQDLVRAVRNIRALTTIGDRKPLAALAVAPREDERRVLAACGSNVRDLACLESLEVAAEATRPPASAAAVASGFEVFVPLGEDVDLEKLRDTLARRAEKQKKGIESLDSKLANESFVERADPDVVESERARRVEMQLELELLERNLAGL